MLRTRCTVIVVAPFSMRLSVLVDVSNNGAAVSRASPAASRAARNRRPISWGNSTGLT